MRDTIWNGIVQKMVLPDGWPKGMKMVLQERGMDTKGMNANRLRSTLQNQPDFQNPGTKNKWKQGVICVFFPKVSL